MVQAKLAVLMEGCSSANHDEPIAVTFLSLLFQKNPCFSTRSRGNYIIALHAHTTIRYIYPIILVSFRCFIPPSLQRQFPSYKRTKFWMSLARASLVVIQAFANGIVCTPPNPTSQKQRYHTEQMYILQIAPAVFKVCKFWHTMTFLTSISTVSPNNCLSLCNI